MKPNDAIRRSDIATIHARYPKGIAIIHRSDDRSEYVARTVTRNAEGALTFDGMQMIGTFPSLEEAVQGIEATLGASMNDWEPGRGVDLRLDRSGTIRPTGT